jgi:2-polyprenyl-6-methoxyphenol hydroxylase-like FAD-dependent oxidoreductase
MRQTDVAIVGAGLAGALAAAMLGRAGYSAVLIDPFETFPGDFRCEKLEQHHVAALRKTGLLDEILATADGHTRIWVARRGRLAERLATKEYGIDYADLVNTLRGLVPAGVPFVRDKVTDIRLTPDRQTVTLEGGEPIAARLVIAANGLNAGLLETLDMRRREISRCHSVSIGFDIRPAAAPRFAFDALTYYGEHPDDRVCYLTLFPIGRRVRANLFVYRALNDPWLRQLRQEPAAVLMECLPRLSRLTGEVEIDGPVKLRPIDLYATENIRRPGIVLAGDAFATACPVTGTGASKAIVDIERLCNTHVPAWLASEGMAAAKIASFYGDPVKLRSDAASATASLFAKRLTLEPGLRWRALRFARYIRDVGRDAVTQCRLVWGPAAIRATGLRWQ